MRWRMRVCQGRVRQMVGSNVSWWYHSPLVSASVPLCSIKSSDLSPSLIAVVIYTTSIAYFLVVCLGIEDSILLLLPQLISFSFPLQPHTSLEICCANSLAGAVTVALIQLIRN